MYYRPWSLIILGLLHLLEPFNKTIFFALYYGTTPVTILRSAFHTPSLLTVVGYFLFFPLAGIAILAVKRWSLTVFLLAELAVIAVNLEYFRWLLQNGHYLLFAFFVFFTLLNTIVVTFLLRPAVRIAYLDPKIRWWEAHPRYQVEIPCWVNGELSAKILNCSKSGVFLSEITGLEVGCNVDLRFQYQNIDVEVTAQVIHKFVVQGKEGAGLKFVKYSKTTTQSLKAILSLLEKKLIPRQRPRRIWYSIS